MKQLLILFILANCLYPYIELHPDRYLGVCYTEKPSTNYNGMWAYLCRTNYRYQDLYIVFDYYYTNQIQFKTPVSINIKTVRFDTNIYSNNTIPEPVDFYNYRTTRRLAKIPINAKYDDRYTRFSYYLSYNEAKDLLKQLKSKKRIVAYLTLYNRGKHDRVIKYYIYKKQLKDLCKLLEHYIACEEQWL